MQRFLGGMLLGIVLGGGGVWFWTQRGPAEAEVAAAHAPDAGVVGSDKGKKKKRPGGARRAGGGETYADEPIPEVTADDLRVVAQGDSLAPRPRDVDLGSDSEVRDLSQGEIDDSFRGAASGITDCITAARGPAPVQGRIEVGVVVSAEGRVIQTRVEAPSYLQKRGLYRCVRGEVSRLRFPSAGKDTVVRVPFDLS
jgi:hypothetical protein